jgi:hypothetical protein
MLAPLNFQTFLRLCVIKAMPPRHHVHPGTLDKKYFCSFRRPAYQRAKAVVIARCTAESQVQRPFESPYVHEGGKNETIDLIFLLYSSLVALLV